MKRILGAALAALLLPSAVLAAPPAPSGTIAIADGSDLSFGGYVSFDTTVSGKLKGYQYPLVYVACYQDVKVYGRLDYPDTVFVFSSGSSAWVTLGGGAAECIGRLAIYGGLNHGGPTTLAEVDLSVAASSAQAVTDGTFTVNFSASGIASFTV